MLTRTGKPSACQPAKHQTTIQHYLWRRQLTSRFSKTSSTCLTAVPRAEVRITPHHTHQPVDQTALDVAAARRELDLDAERPVLPFFGSVRPYPRLDVLVEALHAIRHEYRVHVLIVHSDDPLALADAAARVCRRDLGDRLANGVSSQIDRFPWPGLARIVGELASI